MNKAKGLKTSKSTQGANGKSVALEDREAVGSWLCEAGPYRDYIESLCGSNPGLKKRDPANKDHPLKPTNAVVYLLESEAHKPPNFTNTQFKSAAELKTHFEKRNATHGWRRIYIMEGLAQDYVAVIGGKFFMDPAFFQRQERTCVWSNKFTPTSDALPQPSLLDPRTSFHLQYCELRQFAEILPNEPFFCERTGRHVGMTPPRHAEESTTGILRRKVSWWCQKTTGGGWDVVILCDPQLKDLSHHEKAEEMRKDVVHRAFQDGYVDFLYSQDRERAQKKPRHPHKSMLMDLVHYYVNHSDLLPAQDWDDPKTSSFFLKKIVAAHYLQLIDYIKAMLPSLELRLTTAWVEEQDQWKSLQTISRRCGNYRDDIEDTLLSLGYPLTDPQSGAFGDWMNDQLDFQYIYFRLKILKQRADNLMTAMTGLASIAGNRQNLEEAKRVKRLNILALLFIPLAYTSSLFSMAENFAPGAGKFWIYWVSAIFALFVTFLTTYILDTALGEDAEWDFKFWKKKGDAKPKMKKVTTGIFDRRVHRS